MTKHLTLLMFIFSAFWSCASTSDDALRQQENFIKNHPTWKGHDFKFEKRKPELNAEEIIEKINNENYNYLSDFNQDQNVNNLDINSLAQHILGF